MLALKFINNTIFRVILGLAIIGGVSTDAGARGFGGGSMSGHGFSRGSTAGGSMHSGYGTSGSVRTGSMRSAPAAPQSRVSSRQFAPAAPSAGMITRGDSSRSAAHNSSTVSNHMSRSTQIGRSEASQSRMTSHNSVSRNASVRGSGTVSNHMSRSTQIGRSEATQSRMTNQTRHGQVSNNSWRHGNIDSRHANIATSLGTSRHGRMAGDFDARHGVAKGNWNNRDWSRGGAWHGDWEHRHPFNNSVFVDIGSHHSHHFNDFDHSRFNDFGHFHHDFDHHNHHHFNSFVFSFGFSPWWYSYAYPYWWYDGYYGYYGYGGYYPPAGDTYNYNYDYNYYGSLQPGSTVNGVQVPDYNGLTASQPQTESDQLFDQGLKAFKEQDYATSIEKFRMAVRLDPNDTVMPFAYAQALVAHNDYEQAAAVISTTLADMAPAKAQISFPGGMYKDRSVLDTQIDNLKRAVEMDPQNSNLQLLYGYELLGAGRTDDAVTPLKTAQRDARTSPTATLLLGLINDLSQPEAKPET